MLKGLVDPNGGDSKWELHWNDHTVTQNVNLSTGKIELLVCHPPNMATQTWANTQLATKQAAIPGLIYASSLLSLGVPNKASFQDHLELIGPPTRFQQLRPRSHEELVKFSNQVCLTLGRWGRQWGVDGTADGGADGGTHMWGCRWEPCCWCQRL